MNKLPKEKRDKILLIGIGAALICAALWYLVLSNQAEKLQKLRDSVLDIESKVRRAEVLTKRGKLIEADLANLRKEAAAVESEMIPVEQVPGRTWLYDTLSNFIKGKHRVTITTMSNDPVIGKQFLLLPKFAYSAAAYHVELRGFYHDIGKFLAAFENSFPYMNIHEVQMWPLATPKAATTATADLGDDLQNSVDREQLRMTMKVVVLFKPAGSS